MSTPAKIRRTQEERSGETRKRLLDATIECLFTFGYAGTTTTLIAERAGVSRGAQLHHFPRKQELVTAAVEHLFNLRLAQFREAAAELPQGAERTGAAIDILWAMFKGSTFYAWLELTVAARTDERLREALTAITERFMNGVHEARRAVLGEGGEMDELTTGFVFKLLEGLALERIITDQDEALTLDLLKTLSRLLPPPGKPPG